ncbi:MAG TPA: Jag N-terminal domain-containing protein [Candidatus Faecivicinus avistercoris]|nr:Jag N-terminal domain-containing protein [Candidatus Faecivicinus avistercoris]
MKFIESTGKTVKDAISKGLAELGCDSADVDIQVIEMGSPGLFGIFGRPAKVRLTLKESDKDLEIDLPVLSIDQPSGRKREKAKPEKARADKPQKAEKPEKKQEAPKPREERDDAAKPEAPKPRPEKKKREPKPQKPAAETAPETEVPAPAPVEQEPFVPTPDDQLSETAHNARAFLMGLTERMGVPAQIAVSESPEQIRMVLSGENMSILIGRRGETLDALQYLTSLNVNRAREDYLRVSLDTENYRAKREEALRKLAVRMAGRCKKSGRRVALEPMNPYERRILHSALQADPDVTTHSEGEEPYRRVIITLK